MSEYVNEDPMQEQAQLDDQALIREYMKACVRAKSPGDLDGLDDDTLRAVYLASGALGCPTRTGYST